MKRANPGTEDEVSFDQVLGSVEELFGYPLGGHADLCVALRARYEVPGLSAEERMLGLVEDSIHWKAEHQPGPPPLPEYWDGEVSEQSRMVARHFAGLIGFARHLNDIVDDPQWGETSLLGTFFADLNPRSDGLETPVYYFGASGAPAWWVFEKPSQAVAFEQRLLDLETTDDDAREALLKSLVDEYPRARRWFWRNLKPYGIEEADPRRAFPDQDAKRLLASYDALGPIGRVLVERAGGATGAQLTAKETSNAIRVAGLDPGHPPNVLLRLLALALSEPAKARAEANEIVNKSMGISLTQRWARRVLESAPPFDRSSP